MTLLDRKGAVPQWDNWNFVEYIDWFNLGQCERNKYSIKALQAYKFCWNLQKAALEEDFTIRKHCRILTETKLTYLFNVISHKMTVFTDYAILSLLFANNFVVNAM